MGTALIRSQTNKTRRLRAHKIYFTTFQKTNKTIGFCCLSLTFVLIEPMFLKNHNVSKRKIGKHYFEWEKYDNKTEWVQYVVRKFTPKKLYQSNRIKLTYHSVCENSINDLWNNPYLNFRKYKQQNKDKETTKIYMIITYFIITQYTSKILY